MLDRHTGVVIKGNTFMEVELLPAYCHCHPVISGSWFESTGLFEMQFQVPPPDGGPTQGGEREPAARRAGAPFISDWLLTGQIT